VIMAVFGFDTETDHDPEGTRAWLVQWCMATPQGKYWTGTSAGSFADFLIDHFFEHPKPKAYVYVHNLSYDWFFIFDELMDRCSEHSLKVTPILRTGKIISVTIEPSEDSEYDEGYVVFRDSSLKIPGSSVQSLGKMIGLPKLDGVSDFHPLWSEEVDLRNKANWEYVKRDALIVAVAMNRMHKTGHKKSTASGDAWKAMKLFISKGKHYKKDLKWQWLFPKLSVELDQELRRAYWGGLNVSQYKGLNEGVITHEDVHSMYPTVMSYDPLPYGVPIIQFHLPHYNALYIVATRCRFSLKDDSEVPYFPWYMFKNKVDCIVEGVPYGTVMESMYEWHEMMLTNVDIDVLENWYDIDFDPDYCHTYYVFHSKIGVFADYIAEHMKKKQAAKKGSLEYNAAKIAMNSGYGRMALSPESVQTSIEPYQAFNDQGEQVTMYRFVADDVISEAVENYVPYAIFTTAFARARLLENCLQTIKEGKKVYHCDTDSVIHSGPESPEMDHGDHLGGWGIEARPVKLYEGGFKRYIEVLHEPVRTLKDISMACAGVPQRQTDDGVPYGMWVELLDDFSLITTGAELGHEHYVIKSEWLRKLYTDHGRDPDDVNTLKLLPHHVPGGIVLKGHTHKLDDGMQSVSFRRSRI